VAGSNLPWLESSGIKTEKIVSWDFQGKRYPLIPLMLLLYALVPADHVS
jgi:hypothetical protein